MVDMDWARGQLNRAGYSGSDPRDRALIGNSVELLLKEFIKQQHTDQQHVREVIQLFAKLAAGQDIAPRDAQGFNASWKQFRLGDVAVGSQIRVKVDAYEGKAGESHNGRVGRLVAARGGRAVVQYAESAEGTGHHHDPQVLEVYS